ncbi:DUF6442 family protein [Clostridium beijerinckii]|mgnify:CR=1 FL=1|jgi:hypothetical protein|uniref:DUF2178 domain-containing protein n=2 Tax=Clostridium beijerinckii TaxID=1520 RepID=A0AAE2RSD5_CLOBE|nr:DUF6442 family protein [Clostridium beijerinckii]ABR35672.1 conserved hypothetical protein [Clostridium beijerinckii NCIMB 8052]AIU01279.1 hypothetical protein Cbs_3550 [Clostridium beijerinckii ATCC 35702]MBF7809689.1 hypothetical protein [Clostridium beijerinckii]NRT69535.1 hypothetical protein [Clostridium beijerinckii]NRT84318.1 hypothetical protein [Clostridium beijerinckii]
MKKDITAYFALVFGLLLVSIGLYLIKTIIEPQGIMRALPYVCVGLGCGILGHGIGNIISNRVLKNHPDIDKQIKIEKLDERNIAIGNHAKAKAYDMMIFIFGALILTFSLMGVDMVAILLLVFAYLFIVGYGIYYRYKFDKEL